MDYINHNTTLRTNKHLNFCERFYIEKQLAEDRPISSIAKALGRSRTTIHNEIKRGLVIQIKQNKSCMMYLADSGQAKYEKSRKGSFNTLKAGAIEPFLSWLDHKVLIDKWSIDAAIGYAKLHHLFKRNAMVCTKTVYNYLHQNILGFTSMDLPLVLRRSMRKSHSRMHKRNLGKSIDLRDKSIETREEFGHWELDTVRGIKDKKDSVLVTLLERKSRMYVALLCPSAKAGDVKATLQKWLSTFSKYSGLSPLCKTITSDNGREFAEISTLETKNLKIYFAHPYSAYERGSNERHNGLLRRFIPKGKPIKDVSVKTLKRFLHWCNNLPRKILHYKTPQEVFLQEVKQLVDLESVQFHIAI